MPTNFQINDNVYLKKEPETIGKIIQIDKNLEDITTCQIMWNDSSRSDIQWTNKINKLHV